MVDQRTGIVIQVITHESNFSWALRKGADRPFLHSHGSFQKASQAESDARAVVARGNGKVAYVEWIAAGEAG